MNVDSADETFCRRVFTMAEPLGHSFPIRKVACFASRHTHLISVVGGIGSTEGVMMEIESTTHLPQRSARVPRNGRVREWIRTPKGLHPVLYSLARGTWFRYDENGSIMGIYYRA